MYIYVNMYVHINTNFHERDDTTNVVMDVMELKHIYIRVCEIWHKGLRFIFEEHVLHIYTRQISWWMLWNWSTHTYIHTRISMTEIKQWNPWRFWKLCYGIEAHIYTCLRDMARRTPLHIWRTCSAHIYTSIRDLA